MPKLRSLASIVFILVVAIGASSSVVCAEQGDRADAKSNDEFRRQVAAICQSYRAHNTTKGRELIEQFRLSNPEAWFSEHLGPDRGADLAKRYDRLYANFAESLEHTVEAVVANRGAELITSLDNGNGETPTGASRPGAKLSGVVPVNPAALFYANFKITVQRRDTTSWANTFVLQDGVFRFVGFGGWPFWVWQDGTEGAAPKNGSFSTPPILISRIDPAYPPEAKSRKVEGVVVVHLLIDKEGRVKKAEVVRGEQLLVEAALDSARKSRFKPATLGGAACESDATININFALH